MDMNFGRASHVGGLGGTAHQRIGVDVWLLPSSQEASVAYNLYRTRERLQFWYKMKTRSIQNLHTYEPLPLLGFLGTT
eukprot:scaffold1504_cov417-Prasinococcus_capsulatus_cf.AAC.7